LVGANPNPAAMLVFQSKEQAIAEDAYLNTTNYRLGGGRFDMSSNLVHSNRSKWVQLKDGIPTEAIGVPTVAPSTMYA